jgi:4-amino-4-deoxy-L-arabinose transferase-like glycosyltransferase
MKLSKTLARIELTIAAAILVVPAVIAPYTNIEWRNGGLVGAAVLLVGGVGLACLLIGSVGRIATLLAEWLLPRVSLTGVLLAGLVLHFAVAFTTAPVPASDMKTYLLLAERLAAGGPYVDDQGHLSFWPPGLPLFLAPFVWLCGPTLAAVATANSILYVLCLVAVRSLAARLFGREAAIVAAVMFTIWPTRVLLSGVAAKELLTLCLVTGGMALVLAVLQPSTGRPLLLGALAGGAFGWASLSQPGLLLLIFALPIICRFAASQLGPRVFTLRITVVVVASMLVSGAWSIRNCVVFDGRFCGVATNGGSVFYRANNPLATGAWIAEGPIALTKLPELEQNALGFQLGREWIVANPLAAARLSAQKLLLFLGNDGFGPYWAIFRGLGLDHDESARNDSPLRLMWFQAADYASLAFWLLFTAMCARALIEYQFSRRPLDGRLSLLLYPILYSIVVFLVFESGARQHITAAGPLFALASSGARRSDPRVDGGQQAASDSGSRHRDWRRQRGAMPARARVAEDSRQRLS